MTKIKQVMKCKGCNGKGETMDLVPGGWGVIPVAALCEECMGMGEREYEIEVEDTVDDFTQSIINNRTHFNK